MMGASGGIARLDRSHHSLSGAPLKSHQKSLVTGCRSRPSLQVRNVAEFTERKAPGGNGNGASSLGLESDQAGIGYDIMRKANYVVGKEELDPSTAYRATSLSVREHLIDSFNKTQKYWK